VPDGPLVIEDTTAHPLFREVPTVKSMGVRAYAGIPLVMGGHSIGSFCAIDFAPRAWRDIDIETLQELANAAMREISLRRLVGEAQQRARSRETLLMALEQQLPNALNMVNMALHALGGDRRDAMRWTRRYETTQQSGVCDRRRSGRGARRTRADRLLRCGWQSSQGHVAGQRIDRPPL